MSLPNEKKLSDDELLEIGRRVLTDEADALNSAASRTGMELVKAAHLVSRCKGRVVVTGLGKSGHVGRKAAATFASLGVPAFFLHATEGSHGDLGMVCNNDLGIFVCNSGETHEVIALIPYFKRIAAPIIAVTGNVNSTLAKEADVVLNTHVEREAEPLNLAPTSSTTLQMAMCDAIAGMTTLLIGLKKEDFARFHPGGTLGKSLLTRVKDIMSSGSELPVTKDSALVRDALFEITSKGYGSTAVIDKNGKLVGIFTDGDLRRFIEKHGDQGLDMPVTDGMTKTPRVISPDKLAVEALHMIEQWEISVLIAVDEENKPVGILHVHDILKAGVA